MSILEVKIDKRQIEKIQRELAGVKGGMAKTMPAAINKTLTTARAIVARRIKEHVNLKIGTIKKHMSKSKATRSRFSGKIFTDRSAAIRIPLIYYGAKQLKSGDVSYKVSNAEGRKKIQYDGQRNPVFIATMPNGKRGVFKRVGPGKRLPITELKGPSLTRAANTASKQIFKRLRREVNRVFMQNLTSQVDRLLTRKK